MGDSRVIALGKDEVQCENHMVYLREKRTHDSPLRMKTLRSELADNEPHDVDNDEGPCTQPDNPTVLLPETLANVDAVDRELLSERWGQ